jgi:metal-responsive CopG/Arc/MetJ family transcriptional regulator
MPSSKAAPEEVQIVIPGVPASLVADIDQLAKKDERKRSSYIRKLLAEIVAEKKSHAQKAA